MFLLTLTMSYTQLSLILLGATLVDTLVFISLTVAFTILLTNFNSSPRVAILAPCWQRVSRVGDSTHQAPLRMLFVMGLWRLNMPLRFRFTHTHMQTQTHTHKQTHCATHCGTHCDVLHATTFMLLVTLHWLRHKSIYGSFPPLSALPVYLPLSHPLLPCRVSIWSDNFYF